MSQYAIVFDTDDAKDVLQDSLEADGIFAELATHYGAYPYLVELLPKPAAVPGQGCSFCAGLGTIKKGSVTCPDCGPGSAGPVTPPADAENA